MKRERCQRTYENQEVFYISKGIKKMNYCICRQINVAQPCAARPWHTDTQQYFRMGYSIDCFNKT